MQSRTSVASYFLPCILTPFSCVIYEIFSDFNLGSNSLLTHVEQ